jgi:hypothetical protein
MKGKRGTAVFIFKILVGLRVHLRAPKTLATGKYSVVGLAIETWLRRSREEVWAFSGREKYVASARNRKTIPQTLSGVAHHTRCVQIEGSWEPHYMR